MEEVAKMLVEYGAPLLATFLGTFLVTLIGGLVQDLRVKTKVDITDKQQQAIEHIAMQAVDYAEERARQWATEGRTMPGPQKLEEAIQWAASELKERNLGEVAGVRLARLVESWLGSRRGNEARLQPEMAQ